MICKRSRVSERDIVVHGSKKSDFLEKSDF
jgi:hypothetical protein